MRIQVMRGVIGTDGAAWLPGEIREASIGFARELIARGSAIPAPDVSTRAPEPAAVDPSTAPRRGRPRGG
jgi:hypothetical protein